MKRLALLAALAFVVAAHSAAVQSQQPYAGLETRSIKALSEEQIADLKAGRGMQLALAAELNGYPGPLHVIELADSLHLSETQRTKVQALFAAMKVEAVALGEQLIAQEAALDRQFAGRTMTEAGLAAQLQAIGATQAALRTVHLKYHLVTLDVLTPMQVRRYAELRGYASGSQQRHPHGSPRH
jgi:Spy/CpxP family protein refolding chaperone